MQTAKQSLDAMIRTLPEDARFEDIRYRLYTMEKIAAGLESLEKHGGILHEEVKVALAKQHERDFAAAVAGTLAELGPIS